MELRIMMNMIVELNTHSIQEREKQLILAQTCIANCIQIEILKF